MKTLPLLVVTVIVLATSTSAGTGSFLTQKKADWDFIQRTGGIEITSSETRKGKSYLNIRYDVSGLTTVTRKPEQLNSGIVVKSMKASFKDGSIHIGVITSTPRKNQKNEINHMVELPEIESGVYPVFYGKSKDPEKKIGLVAL